MKISYNAASYLHKGKHKVAWFTFFMYNVIVLLSKMIKTVNSELKHQHSRFRWH